MGAVSLDFPLSSVCLCAAQAGTVALPCTAPTLVRVKSAAWALVPVASIVLAVVAVRATAGAASMLTYLSLAAVPPLAALALARAVRWGRRSLAFLVIPLFAVSWMARSSIAGQAAAVALSILACVALAVLLTQVAPVRWLKIGIVLTAVGDVAMIGAHYLQPAQDLLNFATPSFDLPAFQRVLFSGVVMGFGDFFLAALLGAVLAVEGARYQGRAALITFGMALVFDLLFIAIPVLPATVPVAVALLVVERRGRRAEGAATPPKVLGPIATGIRDPLARTMVGDDRHTDTQPADNRRGHLVAGRDGRTR
jgi:prepilin signal peptidase PulO-like enzyme (type II secretory pathway)